MSDHAAWETITVRGGQAVEKLRKLLHEGNVRRVVVKQKGRTVAEFPLAVGLVGALLAPVLAAIATVVALVADCSVDVERAKGAASRSKSSRVGASVPVKPRARKRA